jgi:hypothetical protein
MSPLLGHTPPPLALASLGPESPFHRYAGVPADRELAIALDKFRVSSDPGPDADADGGDADAVDEMAEDDTAAPDATARAAGDDDVLRYWQSDVRRLLVANELISLLKVEPHAGSGGGTYTLLVCIDDLKLPLATIECPTLSHLCAELGSVVAAAQHREKRRQEILSQVAAVDIFFGAVIGLHPERHPLTVELMAVVSEVVAIVVQILKHLCNAPRPVELSADVQPMILTPGHASYPGGHAAYAHAVAIVLAALLRRDATTRARLNSLARSIGQNRVIAGLHFPCDTKAGRALGKLLGKLIHYFANAHFKVESLRLKEKDSCGVSMALTDAQRKKLEPASSRDAAPKLRWLWREARKEWQSRSCSACAGASPPPATSAAP